MSRSSKRGTLLEAAHEIVHRDGAFALTLDAVAHKSGVSKGGVLYHFATKEALIKAMLARMIQHFDQNIAAYAQLYCESMTDHQASATNETTLTKKPQRKVSSLRASPSKASHSHGNWLRAYIQASSDEEESTPEILSGLIAALATHPTLMEPLRQRFEYWQRQACSDGLDATWATVIRLAVDGLWFADIFGLSPPKEKTRKKVLQLLIKMTQEVKLT